MSKHHAVRSACLPLLAAALAACGAGSVEQQRPPVATPEEVQAAAETIAADDLLEQVATLSSDEFEGRAPGTPGEERTVDFMVAEFQALGLQPGNPDGSWTQEVPLVTFTTRSTMSFAAGGKTMRLRFPDDYVAVSRRAAPEVDIVDSDLVFVGYGVVAPEYGWDDFKDVDVAGKTVVMLINDPAVPDPADPSKLDASMFRGDAMTYYGRWTYKYEIASEKGAAAAIIVHETGPAGYPYEVVSGSWGRENYDVVRADGAAGRVAIESWITRDRAVELFAAAGHDFEELKRAATRKDFRPVELGAKATVRATMERSEIRSRNIVAKIEGSDPALKDEYVVYTAHWDHLGRDASREGDQIFNGALDNATGTAGLLQIARAFQSLPKPPARSVLFLAVTAEERGLLGAKHYAANPLYPLERTLANLNIDGLNQWGRTSDIVVVGHGNSTLDDLLAEEAAAAGRTVVPDPEPEKGYFYRSDHFEFAKQGVPALYTDMGTEFIGKPAGYGDQKRNEYTADDYHKPSDEVKPDWDLAGAVDDLRLLFGVGYRVADGHAWPEWKPGTEFRARREAMLAKTE